MQKGKAISSEQERNNEKQKEAVPLKASGVGASVTVPGGRGAE